MVEDSEEAVEVADTDWEGDDVAEGASDPVLVVVGDGESDNPDNFEIFCIGVGFGLCRVSIVDIFFFFVGILLLLSLFSFPSLFLSAFFHQPSDWLEEILNAQMINALC